MQITAYLSVFEEDGEMTKANLNQLAKAIGVENPEDITQTTELVRAIQLQVKQRPSPFLILIFEISKNQ